MMVNIQQGSEKTTPKADIFLMKKMIESNRSAPPEAPASVKAWKLGSVCSFHELSFKGVAIPASDKNRGYSGNLFLSPRWGSNFGMIH